MDKQTLLKMTVIKLREEALKVEGIVGVHGMGKGELLNLLYDRFGIARDVKQRKNNVDVKKTLKTLRAKREEIRKAGDKKLVKKLQRRIHAMKRGTRD
jgi:chorismate mutase